MGQKALLENAIMKAAKLLILAWLSGSTFISGNICKADTEVPCLIFSGSSPEERHVDLSTLNRITFGANSMTVSSSTNEIIPTLELAYSDYHHFRIDNAVADNPVTSKDKIGSESNAGLYLNAVAKSLCLSGTENAQFIVRIYNLQGEIFKTSEMYCGESLPLDGFVNGVYMAHATGGTIQLHLKFIIK